MNSSQNEEPTKASVKITKSSKLSDVTIAGKMTGSFGCIESDSIDVLRDGERALKRR